jgi:hypothetical protein
MDLKEGQQVTVHPYRIEALVLLVRGMLLGRCVSLSSSELKSDLSDLSLF